MTSGRRILPPAVVVGFGVATLGFAAGARAADPTTYDPIDPSLTDAAIVDTPQTRGKHLVWLAAPQRRVGKLLVLLPTGGPTDVPTEFTELGTVAGQLGYHTIILAYRNEAPIAAQPPAGCGPDEFASPSSPNCALHARQEILDGGGESSVVNVNRANTSSTIPAARRRSPCGRRP
jgi:hypothetical protein